MDYQDMQARCIWAEETEQVKENIRGSDKE